MWLKGLKFGMLMQIAIGPICIMVFNTARESGFLKASVLILAIALVDLFYIILASIGVGAIINKEKTKKIMKIFGSLVLSLFGLNIILNVFGINLIPGINLHPSTSNIFIQGLILTLSNPITIIFWGGVLTTKLIEEKMNKKDLVIFSVGCISATLIFLTGIAILGLIVSTFLPEIISKSLNILVGIILIYFGIKVLIKKD